MGEVSVQHALKSLSSDKAKDRADGLADLKHILLQNVHSEALTALDDKGYYGIFKALFRFISLEKSLYKRSSTKPVTRTTSLSRLSTCASVLRTTVEVSVKSIRFKTFRAIVYHITDAQSAPGDALWETPSGDYIKALRTLLQHPAHVEHLSKEDWCNLIDFCLVGIGSTDHQSPNELSIRTSQSLAAESFSDAGSRSASRDPATRRRTRDGEVNGGGSAEVLEHCIQLLTASPHAPIREEAPKLLSGITDYLSSLNNVKSAPHAAFGALNEVLSRTITDNIELVQNTMLSVIPIMRKFWNSKSAALREEMLITLVVGKDVLVSLSRSSAPESLIETLQPLVEQLQSTYLKLPDKETLQVDDTVFGTGSSYLPMGNRSLSPRPGDRRSVANWTTLWSIAYLVQLLDGISPSVHGATDGAPKKRPRLESRTEGIFRDAASAFGPSRVFALQLLPFILSDLDPGADQLASLLRGLTPNILDENPLVAAWTMIAISSIARCPGPTSANLTLEWTQVWELTVRTIASPGTARAACDLAATILHSELLDYPDIADTVESMLSSVELNGPAIITDSALALWSVMIDLRFKANPAQSQDMAKQVCAWLKAVWTTAAVTDRTQAAQIAMFAQPADLLNLLFTCNNRSTGSIRLPFYGPACHVSKSWFRFRQNQELVEYLLLIPDRAVPADHPSADNGTSCVSTSLRPLHPGDQVVLDLLQSRADGFTQLWASLIETKSHSVTGEIVQIFSSFCVTAYIFLETVPSGLHRTRDLQTTTEKLWTALCEFLSKGHRELLNACLNIVSPFALSLRQPLRQDDSIVKAVCRMGPALISILEDVRERERAPGTEVDLMDVDDPFSDYGNRSDSTETVLLANRLDSPMPLFEDDDSVRLAMTVQLSLLLRVYDQDKNCIVPWTDSVLAYLTSLQDPDILAGWYHIISFVTTEPQMSRAAACELLEFMGEACLRSCQLERCEASTSACVNLLSCLVPLWTSHTDDDLAESALDIYRWFMTSLLEEGLGSTPRSLIRVARLLERVLNTVPTFSGDESLPSARTGLFKIISDGDLVVKYHVSKIVPSIFGRFVLKEHDAIFGDVLENLPRDPDWVEGIALRLYLLSQLASRWHTLLRRSIYHIFEAPGRVPESAPYAKACLQNVASALGLADSKAILQLFSPQILYTWMESRALTELPYTVFGYPTLKDFMFDVQDEAVAQIMMRVKEEDMNDISSTMGSSFEELLALSFAKAEAYSVARDMSIPPSQDQESKGAENTMKRLLGKDRFFELIENSFAEVVATLFQSVDQSELAAKAFSKRPEFQFALEIWTEIEDRSSSKPIVPGSQQPSFRAKFLLDELEFVSRRLNLKVVDIWTPTLFSFVARSLLESIHPALGSLHTCTVLRRLQILVCVAGPVALSDYPLEMLLHSLRPYITDFQCSEDAIKLFWYLIDRGQKYLFENPSFVAGLAVSTLASLRGFLSTTQDSTTQESHFRATLTQAESFRRWFSSFLDKYEPSKLDEKSVDSLRKIFRSSQNIEPVGSARRGTYEGELMTELLHDKRSASPLLSRSATDLVFSLLCTEFQIPSDFRDDILGDDDAAAANAIAVLESIESQALGRGYRLWAARALGRAYAASGVVNDSLLKEQRVTFVDSSGLSPHSSSKYAILHSLCDLLLSSGFRNAGLAERTLQVIVQKLAEYPALEECMTAIPPPFIKSLLWAPYQCPELSVRELDRFEREYTICWNGDITAVEWAKELTLALSINAAKDPVIGSLVPILFSVPSLAVHLLPYILHDVLLSEFDGNQMVRHVVSKVFRDAFKDLKDSTLHHIRLILYCILYLRYQELPHESTADERDEWLEVDFLEAAAAAIKCRMHKTALLFVEIHASRTAKLSRRASTSRSAHSPELLHDIFKNIDDPDSFYGVQQETSLESIISRFEHEGSGIKNLFFQSANYDASIKLSNTADDTNTVRIIEALNSTNLQGIASVMFNAPAATTGKASAFDEVLSTALYLQQWDIPVPSTSSATGNLFKSLQSFNTLEDKGQLIKILDECLLGVLDHLMEENQSVDSLRLSMRTLGILTELDEVLASNSHDQVKEAWGRMLKRSSWLKFERFDDISQILSGHEAIFSSMSRKAPIRAMLGISGRDAQFLEVEVIRQSLRINREHRAHQSSLKSAMLLSKLTEPCAQVGVKMDVAATYDLANVLWDQGEMTTSIRMLQPLVDQPDIQAQTVAINRPEILANLGHHIAEARLEKPDVIIQKYLTPAVKDLHGRLEGEEAGRVFHEFAKFCDQQLQNPDLLEDFRRIEQLRLRKEQEVLDFEEMMKSTQGRERDQLRVYRNKARQWFELDDREYQRLKRSRGSLLEQCLENYLLSLNACDVFKNDVLRFCALWLDNSDSDIANASVSKYLGQIPSRKFAPLLSQLSSRLLDTDDAFQQLLSPLIFRICIEHPYHGMYQLFSSSKTKGGKDETSMSRFRAAGKLVEQAKSHPTAGPTWVTVHNTCISYARFAMDRLEEKIKSGSKVLLRKSATGQRLEQDVARQKIPPPTMKIELRVDCDYSQLPRVVKFLPEFTVASGVSAPKIVTAIGSDGKQYKQLFKGGNDDLRQDSIMEQVFEQVSDLLHDHRDTQQRKLGIRTYKVLPLTANAGIIEFVQNTIPLNDYLLPAHQKHFPKNLKPSACRKHIGDAQSKSVEQRVKVFRQVTANFQPVMRYFFMERFPNPDDWFSSRLAYTRSTAAISILGHILGLGDRHGHNILLDSKTGEVVHIDLGVAFEQGRILPVPEVVPFRLTRDLVDGMGITKTEGVFRRCCEFTLETLREESYSIMTILDVLRYDPLYSWSLSPLRMKKMQDTQEAAAGAEASTINGKRKAVNEPSEADRALTVVAKKLGKSLSAAATVNELIQQATDERNLAVLYCGWAAYA